MQQEFMRFGRLSLDQGQGINPHIHHIYTFMSLIRTLPLLYTVRSIPQPLRLLGVVHLHAMIICTYFYSNITHTYHISDLGP